MLSKLEVVAPSIRAGSSVACRQFICTELTIKRLSFDCCVTDQMCDALWHEVTLPICPWTRELRIGFKY